MKSLILVTSILFLVSASSCRPNESKPDGGPCSYQITPYPAIVISIDSSDAETVNVWCTVNALEADTIDYYHVNNRHTTLSAIKLEKLKPGDTLIYQHHQITSGACNPDVFRLLLKQELE